VRRQSPAAVVKHVLLSDFAEILNPYEADPIPSKGGVGIAPKDQDAVFEELRQVGTATKKVKGTGLGLTLCRKLVELHEDRIWVKNQPGQGATFTFTIPVRRSEQARH